jgi:hypothetical protein
MFRRVPGRCERQRDGEGRSGEAEHATDEQCAAEAVNADGPGDDETGDDGDLRADADPLRFVAVDQ